MERRGIDRRLSAQNLVDALPLAREGFTYNGKPCLRQVAAQFLSMGHGLEDKALAGSAHPGCRRQDGDDQLTAHAENNDVLGVIVLKAIQPRRAYGTDMSRKPCRLNVRLRALHRPAVDVRGNRERNLRPFSSRGTSLLQAACHNGDGKVGVVGTDIRQAAARPHIAKSRRQARGKLRGHGVSFSGLKGPHRYTEGGPRPAGAAFLCLSFM